MIARLLFLLLVGSGFPGIAAARTGIGSHSIIYSHDIGGSRLGRILPGAHRLQLLASTFSLDSRRFAIAECDNPRTETSYDEAGRVRSQVDAARATTEYTYDDGAGAGRRKEVIQHRAAPNANLVTSYRYDNAGRVRYVTDPRGNTVETQYDAQGRQTKVIYPATDELPASTTETQYDTVGRRIAAVDQEGKITRYRYDGLGRLVEVRQYLDQALAASDSAFSLQPSAAGVVSTRCTYDELGNQLTQTDARGNTTRYQYDEVGRRTQRMLPDNAIETLQYDGWGNLWKRTDFKGYTTTFAYDSQNRLLEKQADPRHPSLSYSHARDQITYGYDAMGNRTDATVEKGAMVLYAEATPFNERNWVKYKETPDGHLTYDHYANGQLKSIGSSRADGVHLGYRYDEINRLVYVDDTSGGPARTSSYTYNANGSLAMLSQPNGIGHAYAYDSLNRLRTLQVGRTVPGEPLIHSYTYSHRASGHRRQVVESSVVTPTRTTTYDYDELYRLTGETVTGGMAGTNGSVYYALDKVGNRLSRTTGGELQPKLPSSTSSFNDRDWLNSDGYDTNGNTLTSLLNSVSIPDVYDFEDRLIVRHKPDGSTVNLSYDSDGILHQKTVLSPGLLSVSTTRYLTDTQNLTSYAQILEERTQTSGGTTVKTYAYGADLLSQSTLEPSATLPVLRYYVYDGLGSVRGVTDESGGITDAYDYDAFGTLIYRSGTTDNDYLYRGERFDSDIGEYCLRARFYNQATGRFWNADTYEGDNADPVSLHRYLYANADPVMFMDPSGHMSLGQVMMTVSIIGTLAGIAIPTIQSGGDPEVFWESVVGAIPIYGSGSSAVANFQAGSYIAGSFDVAITLADIFTARAAGASVKALKAGRKILPGASGVIKGGSSTALAQALGGAQSGLQAHHLLPSAVVRRSALMQKLGINLDHFSNGTWLPSSNPARHLGYHSVYSNAVEMTLRNIEMRNLPLAESEVLVMKLQMRLRALLAEGMPLYDGQGARIEDWLKLLNDGL